MRTRDLLTTSALVGALALAGCASGSGRTAAAPLDRSVPPAPGPAPEYDFPDVHRRTLSNGLQLWVIERPGIPVVNLRLIAEAGAVADPADRPGLASLTAAMLTQGTTSRSATEISDELDFLAANLSASAMQDVAAVNLTVLSRNLDPALAIFADIITNPAFSEEEWTRVREQRLVQLVQSMDQPPTIATQQFGRLVYGEAHPLGRPLLGVPESVRGTTPAMLREFHRARFVPNASHLIVVGDVRADAIREQLDRAFSGWRRGSAPASAQVTAPGPRDATRIYLVDRPGAAQSQIRIGHVGVERNHQDYYALLLLNHILGGQFSSRINMNLREDKGYTYGARSAFEYGRLAGPFVASAGVHTAVTRESVVEFMKELTEIRESRPVTAEELAFAKAGLTRREPLALETNLQLGSRVQEIILYGLPEDYFDDYNQRIAAVPLADVHRVAREYLQPGRFAIVVVGDQSRIESSLRELPYPVEVVELPAVSVRPRQEGAGGEN